MKNVKVSNLLISQLQILIYKSLYFSYKTIILMSSIKKYYMKKLSAFLLSLGVLAGAKCFAQDEVTATGVRFGLKAGINIANITVQNKW
jgi:hypothetical protein